MVKRQKLLDRLLTGSRNIRFDEFVALLEGFGFGWIVFEAATMSLLILMSWSCYPSSHEKTEKPNRTSCASS